MIVLSYKLSKPFLYIKKATETHGREKKIEGMLAPGDRVLVVDDLVASGKSLLETSSLVRGEGATVSDALVLVDREEGGVEKLAKVGVKLHAFAKTSQIVKELYETNLIDKRYFEEIVEKRISEEPDSETTAVLSD